MRVPLAADNAPALIDGELDHAGVEIIAMRPSAGCGGGFDLFQVHELALRLGNNFMLDDEDVAVAQLLFVML